MATIKNTIALQNKMTPVLNSIVTALDTTLNAMQRTGDAGDVAFSEARASVAAANREIQNMNNSLNEVPAEQSPINEGFTVMKGIVTDIGAGILRGIVGGLKKAIVNGIQLASDLEEVQNVVDKTFGDNARSIQIWSEQALEAYGLSELSAKKYASTMGAMIKASRVSDAAVASMSMSLAGLAGDIASFHNLKPEEAFIKLQAAMSGEVEPLRRLGYNMTVANLEAFALSQGITVAYEKMDEASRATLRYNFIMQKTADLQGDFADTSQNFANQQRLLAENWNELTAMMGEYLIPILSTVMIWLNSVLNALKPYAPVILAVASALGVMAVALGVYAAAQWIANSALMAFMAAGGWVIAVVVLIVAAIVGFITWLVQLWKQNLDFRVAVIGIWNGILGFFDKIPLFFMKVGNGIADAFGWAKVTSLEIIQGLANGVIDIINDLIGMLNKIPGVSIDVLGSLNFAGQAAAKEEARKQAREDNEAIKAAEIAAKAAKRDDELAKYAKDQLDAEKSRKRQAAEEARAAAAMEQLASDGMVVNGGELDGIKGEVKITDEDIKLLKDVAQAEFINQFTTLRPELRVEIAEVKETADVSVIMTTLEDMVEQAYGSALQGVG